MYMVNTTVKNIKVTSSALAELFGVTVDHINLLTVKHGMPRDDRNTYDLFKAYRWRLEYLAKNYEKKLEKRETAQDELARKNAQLKDFEIQKQAGTLVEMDEVLKKYSQNVAVFLQSLDTLAYNLAPELKDQSDLRVIQQIIKREVIRIREEIATSL